MSRLMLDLTSGLEEYDGCEKDPWHIVATAALSQSDDIWCGGDHAIVSNFQDAESGETFGLAFIGLPDYDETNQIAYRTDFIMAIADMLLVPIAQSGKITADDVTEIVEHLMDFECYEVREIQEY